MDQLRPFIDERLLGRCTYCGGVPGTRDHVPSKAFLDRRYPDNLPVVDACTSCNESFSKDEEYVASLIECVLAGSADPSAVQRRKIARVLNHSHALRARLDKARTVSGDGIAFGIEPDRVKNVVVKLARGHAWVELAELPEGLPSHVLVVPLPLLDDRERFEEPPQTGVWPEVGSRSMRRLAMNGGMADWIIVQPDRYRYLATVAPGILVRLVIREYLAAEIVWT